MLHYKSQNNCKMDTSLHSKAKKNVDYRFLEAINLIKFKDGRSAQRNRVKRRRKGKGKIRSACNL